MKFRITAALFAVIAVLAWFVLDGRLARSPGPPAPGAANTQPVSPTPVAPPVSVRELLANLQVSPAPRTEATIMYKGYLGPQTPEPRRMSLEFAGGTMRMTLQNTGYTKTLESGELEHFRFKNDENSIVIKMQKTTFIYLKREPGRILQAYPQASVLLTGWMIRGNKPATKIVLLKETHPSWPRPDSLREALPEDLRP